MCGLAALFCFLSAGYADLASTYITSKAFVPRYAEERKDLALRDCESAVPGVSKSAVSLHFWSYVLLLIYTNRGRCVLSVSRERFGLQHVAVNDRAEYCSIHQSDQLGHTTSPNLRRTLVLSIKTSITIA